MTSETDHPRQRTVAELLAEHGEAGAATGRRRRRRAADDDDEGAPAPPPVAAPPVTAQREGGRRAAPPPPPPPPPPPAREQEWDYGYDEPARGGYEADQIDPWDRDAAAETYDPPPRGRAPEPSQWEQEFEPADRGFDPEPPAWDRGAPPAPPPPPGPGPSRRSRESEAPPWQNAEPAAAPRTERHPVVPPVRPQADDPHIDRPTDQMPAVRPKRNGVRDPGLTGPIKHRDLNAPAPAPAAPEDEPRYDEPDSAPMAPPPAMPGGEPRKGRAARRAGADDGGPPTAASAPVFEDHPAGLDGDYPADYDADYDGYEQGEYPPTDFPNDDEDDDEDGPPKRRIMTDEPSSPASAGQAWAAVVGQWIVGAIGGAALWVGFRFLWRELPVVALAAAALVTIGLVVIVRALLRNNDLRTTLSAVGVGLLLTVSPAILVLLGR